MLAFRMAVEFTAGQVEAIARLAQLDLSPAEVELFARQLGEFLGYANELLAVDTSGIEPTAHVGKVQTPDRADEVQPSLDRDAVLANAPDPALGAGLFRVPRVIG
jgi:aspartyl-tRNA(Asn)/glutamyl-tRNA(Gln) amidotransferase subunit C